MAEFSEYDRQHPFEREFTSIFRRHEGANPDQLARACIGAAFDHLLNPPDFREGPLEEAVALQVAAKLIDFVRDEVARVLASMRRPPMPDVT
jgi:hypothetical protein